MAPSSVDWIFGRAHATARRDIALLSYWRENDPSSPEEQETQIVHCSNGQIETIFVPYHCVDILKLAEPSPHLLAVGLEGDVAVIESTTLHRSLLDDSDNGPSGRGDIRSLSYVCDEVYAVGMQRQVYKRIHSSDLLNPKWEHLETGISWTPEDTAGFNDISGFSSEELYAVGWRGEMQICESGQWQIIESLTNVKLERVLAAPNGKVYAAGIRGVVVSGRGNSFEVLFQTATEDSIWGMCWAFETLWMVTANTLYRLADDDLEAVDPGIDETMTYRCLTEADGRLWSTGANHVIYTDDGVEWHQVMF